MRIQLGHLFFLSFFFSVQHVRGHIGRQNVILCVMTSCDFLCSPLFQIPQCYPDHVPAHLALPNHSGDYKQGCSQASPGSEGFGESHPAGTWCIYLCTMCSVSRSLLIEHAYSAGWVTDPSSISHTFFYAKDVFIVLKPHQENQEPSGFDEWYEIVWL